MEQIIIIIIIIIIIFIAFIAHFHIQRYDQMGITPIKLKQKSYYILSIY